LELARGRVVTGDDRRLLIQDLAGEVVTLAETIRASAGP